MPRTAPTRAIWIAVRSRFGPRSKPESLRMKESQLLKERIANEEIGQRYFVVTGEKGVGKTCFLNTVTINTAGVIKVQAQQGHSEDTVIHDTLVELANAPFKFMKPLKSAERVIFWYRMITLGRSPIVVINVGERKDGQEYANLTGAARNLVDKYKLRVVVHGSPNSLDKAILQTSRQRVIHIEPMTKEMVWNIDHLEEFFKYSEQAGLNDTAYAVLGRIPSRYEELWDNAKIDLRNGKNPQQIIGFHLCAKISEAIDIVEDSKTKSVAMKEIIQAFDTDKNWIFCVTLISENLKRPNPDKVFRKIQRDGVFVLTPATNCIGIVLRHSLSREPSLDELEELLNITKE